MVLGGGGAGWRSADQQISALMVWMLLHVLLYVPTGNTSSELLLNQEVHGSLKRCITTIKNQSSWTGVMGSGYLGQQRCHSTAPEGLRHEGGHELHLILTCESVAQHCTFRRSCRGQHTVHT